MTIPCITTCISLTRYILATSSVQPTNKSVIAWFLVSLVCILAGNVGLAALFLIVDSIELKTFCAIIHDQQVLVEPPNAFSKEWILSFVPSSAILCAAAISLVADFKVKWFIDNHIQHVHGGLAAQGANFAGAGRNFNFISNLYSF